MAKKRTPRTPKKGQPRKSSAPPKPDWAPAFLEALRGNANIRASCLIAAIGRTSVYKRRDEDKAFAADMADALDDAVDDLELEARRRACEGLRRVKFHQGAPIMVQVFNPDGSLRLRPDGSPLTVPYVEHEYSDTLMIFLLKAHRPEKYRENVNLEFSGEIVNTLEYPQDDDDERAEEG